MNTMKTTLDHKVRTTQHRQLEVDGVSIFYREAGDPTQQTILMLHGFPSSSHMYRDVIAGLSDQYHIIAPDYPGFGLSDTPSMETFAYTFDHIAELMEAFINHLKLDSFYLMMHDYGGPIGMRFAVANPDKIKGLIIQNANVYAEGLGEWAQKIGGYVQQEKYEELSVFKDSLMSAEGIKNQYLIGARAPQKVDPVSYLTDSAFFDREHVRSIQSALFANYSTNFPKYPEWQAFLRTQQPKTLVIWGEHDKFFSKEGAQAYAKDLDEVDIHIFDGGHFMLEEYYEEAVGLIKSFIN